MTSRTAGYERLSVNARGRDFVVGDLHGQVDMLDHLLKTVDFNPRQDRLLSVGDLIDRGPGSAELLRRYHSEKGFHAILGNHEAMMIRAAEDEEVDRGWRASGAEWTRSLSLTELRELTQIAATLPLVMELPLSDGRVVGLVHAEIRPGVTWAKLRSLSLQGWEAIWDPDERDAEAAIWGRSRLKSLGLMTKNPKATGMGPEQLERRRASLTPVKGIDMVIAGHTIIPIHQPVRIANQLFVDTGAFMRGGRLTLVEPLTARYWQAIRATGGRLRVLRRSGSVLPGPFKVSAFWKG